MTERHANPKPRGGALVLASLLLAAAPAGAEGWSIFKLESFPDTASCMQKARMVISQYMFDHGGAETGADSWSVYGYDLEPGQQDAVIMCPEGETGAINAILVVQSESESDLRIQAADALVAIWDGN